MLKFPGGSSVASAHRSGHGRGGAARGVCAGDEEAVRGGGCHGGHAERNAAGHPRVPGAAIDLLCLRIFPPSSVPCSLACCLRLSLSRSHCSRFRILPIFLRLQEGENDHAEVVVVFEPEGTSLMMGGLHPRVRAGISYPHAHAHVHSLAIAEEGAWLLCAGQTLVNTQQCQGPARSRTCGAHEQLFLGAALERLVGNRVSCGCCRRRCLRSR